MSQVVSFVGYVPPARFDDVPWETAQIEEATSETGSWSVLETVSLGTPDADPSDPAARSFSTVLGTDVDLWYRVVFVDGDGNTSEPTAPLQNVESVYPAASAYADVDELARILKIRTPTQDQTDAMTRVLLGAAGEINSEIGLTNDDLSGWQLSLATEVNLERAVEHWQQQEAAFGIIGLGSEFGGTHTATDSWNRHASKLAPLKASWGLA